jgi:hypothetical protein
MYGEFVAQHDCGAQNVAPCRCPAVIDDCQRPGMNSPGVAAPAYLIFQQLLRLLRLLGRTYSTKDSEL